MSEFANKFRVGDRVIIDGGGYDGMVAVIREAALYGDCWIVDILKLDRTDSVEASWIRCPSVNFRSADDWSQLGAVGREIGGDTLYFTPSQKWKFVEGVGYVLQPEDPPGEPG